MLVSTCVEGVSTSQRRAMIMPASMTPRTRTMANAGQTWRESWLDRGPSTSRSSTKGMKSATSEAIMAATMPEMMRGNAGRR